MKKKGPPAPSQRKLALDITGRRKIGLSASAALEDGGEKYLQENFSFEKEKPSRTLPKKTYSGYYWSPKNQPECQCSVR